jgi:hypothetical protein
MPSWMDGKDKAILREDVGLDESEQASTSTAALYYVYVDACRAFSGFIMISA